MKFLKLKFILFKYDFKLLIKYGGNAIKIKKITTTGNRIFSAKCIVTKFSANNKSKSFEVTFKDSACMIPVRLDKFPKMFGLKIKKELMN